MDFPKLVIATDGNCTGVLLDGIFIGQGIRRLDFSTENKDGDMSPTIRIMELDAQRAKLVPDTGQFAEFLEKLSGKD